MHFTRRSTTAAATTAAVCLFAGGAAQAATVPGGGDLSTRLGELARPSVRTLPRAEQAAALGLAARGPGSLLREGNRILVDVRFQRGAVMGLDALRGAGAKIVNVSRRYQTVTVSARPFQLRRLARLSRVRAVSEVLTPIIRDSGGPGPATSAYEPCFGAETSEGDEQLRANQARAEFEVEGEGVKVGILSDSFDRDPFSPTGGTEDIASGDLPGPGNPCGKTIPVEVLDDSEGEGADEGRAMAQIVHDLAPRAVLSFATAFTGELSFAENIIELAKNGAQAIVDDVTYFEEPFFQEGPIGVAISEVTTGQDIAYFSAAGNDNLFEEGTENEIGSWEAPEFRESGEGCPQEIEELPSFLNPGHCMDFDPAPGVSEDDNTFGITVAPGETLLVDLQWAEPWAGVETDLDAFLLDSESELIAFSAEENESSQRPFEFVGWENESGSPAEVQLAINRFSGVSPRLKFILLQNGGGVEAIEYPESSGGDVVGPTIFGHGGGEDTMSVGAIRFNTTEKPEFFSSRGPVVHYFEPVEGSSPAGELLSPQELEKPDVVATDGGANTFFGSCATGTWRFFGTSAAAPHASAVAALAREAEPLASAAEVKQAQRKAADAVGAFPATAVGSGLVDAVGTLEQLVGTPPSPGAAPEEAPFPGACLPPRKPAPPTTTTVSPAPSGESTASSVRPRTFIRSHPPHLVRTRQLRAKVVFRFGSDVGDASFVCRIDSGLFRPCRQRLARLFKVGWHTIRVFARDPATGDADRTPAVYRFRVKLIR